MARPARAPKEVKLPAVAAQRHRRFIKTHLPVDALVCSPKAKYLYIGRDGRDVVWSMHNHHANAKWYEALNDTPGRVGPPIEPPPDDVRQYFQDWIERDGHPFWPFWENVASWWAIRDLPNLMLLHFEALKQDMPGQTRRIAEFLEIPIDESRWDAIVEHCTFPYMKAHAAKCVPLGGAFWDAGAQVFIHSGQNGRWRDVLTSEECARYDALAAEKLGRECARLRPAARPGCSPVLWAWADRPSCSTRWRTTGGATRFAPSCGASCCSARRCCGWAGSSAHASRDAGSDRS